MTALLERLIDHVDVYGITHRLLINVQTLLKDHFVGLYLGGSLAIGDFDPQHSDIDFLVVTSRDLSEEAFLALRDLHRRMVAGGSKWGRELEGSYIPLRAVRRHDPADAMHPHIERGGELCVERHDSDWVIQRHIIREHGLVMAGPEPKSLIEPVTPDDLRRAVRELSGWWELQLADTSRIKRSPYQSYAVLTMCRMLYTLEHGSVVSKPIAARWAQENFGARWETLIELALRYEVDLKNLNDTQEFIRFTLAYSQHLEC